MKTVKIFFILTLLFVISITIFSCSSNNSTGGQVNPNNVGSPFTLKYEIITSSTIVAGPGGNFGTIFYENGSNQPEIDNSFTSGTTWTKQVTVTTSNRPFLALLQVSNSIYMSAPGTVIGNIYVNGNRVAHVENPTISSGTINGAIVVISYQIN